MTLVSEIERTELVNQLVATIGEGPAETLMKCVLPDGRNQLATKDDLRVLSAEMATKEDLKALGTELRAEMATKDDLRVLSAEMATKEDLKALGTELRAEFAKQTRMYLMVLTAFVVPIWAAMAAQFFV